MKPTEERIREIVQEEFSKREAAANSPAAVIQNQISITKARMEWAKRIIRDPQKLQEILDASEDILRSYSRLL